MPDTVTIPLAGDHSAEVAPAEAMTVGEMEQAIANLDLSAVDIANLDGSAVVRLLLQVAPQMNRVLTVVLTRSWTLEGPDGEPLPITMETVAAQSFAMVRPLYEHVAPARAELLASLGLGSVVDPKSAQSS